MATQDEVRILRYEVDQLRRRTQELERRFDANPANIQHAEVSAFESTTSATFANLTTDGPSVSVLVPASGKLLVIAGAEPFVSTSPLTATVGISTNAGAAVAFVQLASGFGGTGAMGVARADIVTDLTPGATYTFKLQYKSSVGGTSVSFQARWITVIPL